MQALSESVDLYQNGHLSEAAKDILAHLQTEERQDFGFFDHQSHNSSSRKGRTDLSIAVPRNPDGKQIVASPDSAKTPFSLPSPSDAPNITVESIAPANYNVLGDTQQVQQQPKNTLAHDVYRTGPTPLQVRSGVAGGLPKKKKSHARKQPPGHIARPRNA